MLTRVRVFVPASQGPGRLSKECSVLWLLSGWHFLFTPHPVLQMADEAQEKTQS